MLGLYHYRAGAVSLLGSSRVEYRQYAILALLTPEVKTVTLREALDILELNPNSLDRQVLEGTLKKNLENIELRNVMRLLEAYRKANAFINPTLATHGDVRVTMIDEPMPDGPPLNQRPAAKRLADESNQRLRRDFVPGATFDESILKAPPTSSHPTLSDVSAFLTQEIMPNQLPTLAKTERKPKNNVLITPTDIPKETKGMNILWLGLLAAGGLAASFFVIAPALFSLFPNRAGLVASSPPVVSKPVTPNMAKPVPSTPKPTNSSTSPTPTTQTAAQKLAMQKLEAQKIATQKLEAQKAAALQSAAQKAAAAKLEAQKIAAQKTEAQKLAAVKLEAQKVEAAKLEAQKLAAQKAAALQTAAQKLEAQKLAAQKVEAARLEAQKLAAQSAVLKAEAAKIATQKTEAARLEAQRIAAQKTGAVQLAAQKAAARLETQRQVQRLEAQRLARRLEARREAQRLEARRETQRLEAQRTAARLEAQRTAQRLLEQQAASRAIARREAQQAAAKRAAASVSVRSLNQGSFTAWDRSGAVLRYASWSAVPDSVRALPTSQFRARVYVASSPATLPGLPR